MLSRGEGGGERQGIGRGFYHHPWPVGRAFDRFCCPRGRVIWFFLLAFGVTVLPWVGIWPKILALGWGIWQKFFQNVKSLPYAPPPPFPADLTLGLTALILIIILKLSLSNELWKQLTWLNPGDQIMSTVRVGSVGRHFRFIYRLTHSRYVSWVAVGTRSTYRPQVHRLLTLFIVAVKY